jgi:hypothetical protein
VFNEVVPGLPLKRDIDFSTKIIPGVVPTLRVPYIMSTTELVELKI